jgi:hypothetical protein
VLSGDRVPIIVFPLASFFAIQSREYSSSKPVTLRVRCPGLSACFACLLAFESSIAQMFYPVKSWTCLGERATGPVRM